MIANRKSYELYKLHRCVFHVYMETMHRRIHLFWDGS